MTAFSWLSELMQGVMKFIPRLKLVKAGHGAIRYGRKGKSEVLEPDLYIYWPIIQDFEDFPTASQTVDVAKMALVTKDGEPVSAGGALTFEVVNLRAFCVDNYNTFEDVDDIAQVALRDVVKVHTYDELQASGPRIDRELRRKANRRLANYGVRVKRFALKTFAPSNLIHVVGDSTGAQIVMQPQQQGTEE